jgi:hypothetical protein
MDVLDWEGGDILDVNFHDIGLGEVKGMGKVVLLAGDTFMDMGDWWENIFG